MNPYREPSPPPPHVHDWRTEVLEGHTEGEIEKIYYRCHDCGESRDGNQIVLFVKMWYELFRFLK